MLGPIGSNLLQTLKVMTPSEVERVSRSARSNLIEKPQALEEDTVSFEEEKKAEVISLKSKKENEKKENKNSDKDNQMIKEAKEKKDDSINHHHSKDGPDYALDDSVIFIEEWMKSKDAKKKLQGKDGMKLYGKMSNYEPIRINSEDEDDILISTGTSGILINKKQS